MRALYATSGHALGAVCDRKKVQQVVDRVLNKTKPNGKITPIDVNIASFDSVRNGAEGLLRQSSTLNIVINNAGVMSMPEGKIKDGFWTQFGTNDLGHFLVFRLLKDLLLASSSLDFPSSVVSVLSIGHRLGEVRFDDCNFTERGPYTPWAAYGRAKICNIHLASKIEWRYGSKGLHATSLHPEGILTGLQVHISTAVMEAFNTPRFAVYMKSPAQGAGTLVFLALSKKWANPGGRYCSDYVHQKPGQGTDALTIGDYGPVRVVKPEGK